jgi:hypothetical protein
MCEQESLVSLLDVADLLALRLVSRKTRDWVDAVCSSHRTKALILFVDTEEKTLHELMEEEIAHGIPFCRGLNVRDSSFFSNPLIPEFLDIYGSQIHTLHGPDHWGDVHPDEVAFYEALPNLTQLSTRWLGEPVPAVKMPALERLKLHTIRSEFHDWTTKMNFDFLLNFPNLSHLWLPNMNLVEHVQVLTALGPYFKKRNGLDGSFRRTLTIFLPSYIDILGELSPSEKEDVVDLVQELAVADGRILLENIPIMLLDEAVRLFHHQRGGQLLLSSFGKCVRSLIEFSSSLYEVELPNMRGLDGNWNWEGTAARDGDYSRTVSWPKLEEVKSNMRNECLAKLVFGSGVFRPSVKRLDCDLELLSLGSKEEAHLLLANFPNVTQLTLNVNAEEVGLFRSVMRVLPGSCPKIQFLCLDADFPLGDEDFLGVDGKEGLKLTSPPLVQLTGG